VSDEIIYIPIKKLKKSKWNPRIVKDPEKMKVLIESIKRDGIKYPLLVRRIGDEYEVLDGSRRLEAAEKLGLEKLPCKLVKGNDKDIAKLSLRFHLSQEDLTPEEIVNAILNMIEEGVYQSEREACEDQGISWRTWLEWKKKAKLEERIEREVKLPDTVKAVIEGAEISDDVKEELVEKLEEAPVSKEYVKEIVDRLEENPSLSVDKLVREYSEAEPREIEDGVWEAKGRYAYRIRRSGQNVVFELVDGTIIIGSVSFPKKDLVIVKRLFQKFS